MIKVLFENHHLYYLPNFIQVINEMRERDKYEIIASISNVADKEEKEIFIEACKQLNIKTEKVFLEYRKLIME